MEEFNFTFPRPEKGTGQVFSEAEKADQSLFSARTYTEDESAVISLIAGAAGRWVPALEIAARTGIRERGVRYVVRGLVIKGEPIATKGGPGGGFKWCEDTEEIAACRETLRRAFRAMAFRLSAEERSGILAELAGQERLTQ